MQPLNSLNYVKKIIKAAVLAEPFPWTVDQWVTHAFIIRRAQKPSATFLGDNVAWEKSASS
jgi:hypothetical protein